jgi:hypothetical protein
VGDRDSALMEPRRLRAERSRGMTVIYAVMAAIMILILVQFLLLMVALEDFLSGNHSVLSGAALGSGLCFLAACWLIRYVTGPRTT